MLIYQDPKHISIVINRNNNLNYLRQYPKSLLLIKKIKQSQHYHIHSLAVPNLWVSSKSHIKYGQMVVTLPSIRCKNIS